MAVTNSFSPNTKIQSAQVNANFNGCTDASAWETLVKGGWIPVSDTWTYASATTITVPSGAATYYNKGDRIRLTQSSTVKYFVITAVADTVLTVYGGSDYTVANAAISSIYYSHQESPIGYPDVFTWDITLYNGANNATLTKSVGYATYAQKGKHATIHAFCSSISSPGTSSLFYIVPPVTLEARTGFNPIVGAALLGGTGITARAGYLGVRAGDAVSNRLFVELTTQANLPTDGTLSASFMGVYEID